MQGWERACPAEGCSWRSGVGSATEASWCRPDTATSRTTAAPSGPIPGSRAQDSGIRLSAQHEAGPGRLGVGWQADFGRDIGKPSAEWDLDRTVYPVEDSHRLVATYEGDPVAGAGAVERRRISRIVPPGHRPSLRHRSRDAGVAARTSAPATTGCGRRGPGRSGAWRCAAAWTSTGAWVSRPSSAWRPAERSWSSWRSPTRRATTAGAWATLEGRPLSLLLVSAGLRFDHVNTRNVARVLRRPRHAPRRRSRGRSPLPRGRSPG